MGDGFTSLLKKFTMSKVHQQANTDGPRVLISAEYRSIEKTSLEQSTHFGAKGRLFVLEIISLVAN